MMNQVSLSQIIGKDGIFIDGDWVESKDQDPNGSVRLIQLADIGDGKFINKSKRYLTPEKASELRCTFLKPDDVLIARMPDPIGKSCIFPLLDTPCVTVVDVCIVRPDKNLVLPDWLKFQINSHGFRNKIKKYVTGTTRQRISRGNLERIKFDIPSLEEQKRIVKILDQADSLHQKRKEAIGLLDEYLKSVFLEMFGDPMKNPNKYQVKTINDIALKVTDGEHITPKRIESGIKLLSARNIKNGYIDLKDVDHIPVEEYARIIKRCNPEFGDLLISCSGTIGRVTTVNITEPFTLVRSAALIKPDVSLIDVRYLEYYLRTPHLQDLMSKSVNQSSQANLFLGQINRLPVVLPSLNEQNRFTEIFKKQESLKQKMIIQAQELDTQFQALMQKSFNGGEI